MRLFLITQMPAMTIKTTTLFTQQPLDLLLGGQLDHIDVAYQTYGELNAEKSNAVLICHALTGDAEPYFAKEQHQEGWWQNFMGDGLALGFVDTDVDAHDGSLLSRVEKDLLLDWWLL